MTHLKELRLARNLTQTQVARDINISRASYNNYELDKRQADYDTLLKLAKYFDTTVDYLISEKSTNSKKFSYPFNDDGELYTLLSGLSESEVNDLKLFVDYLYYSRSNKS
jgi:Predicted transcriptional regulators